MTETAYLVLAWDGDGYAEDALHVDPRAILVRHRLGEAVTRAMVIEQFTADVAHYRAGRYRLFPLSRTIDLTVQATVVDPALDF